MGMLERLGVSDRKELAVAESFQSCEKAPKDFRMVYKKVYDRKAVFTATLYFSQLHNEFRVYGLRKYDASVRWVDNDPGERWQSFPLDGSRPIFTFKEAYNLLQGRSVLTRRQRRNGGSYLSWAQLDFKYIDPEGDYCWTFFPSRGFNVRSGLREELAGNGIHPARLANLAKSLEQGNREVILIVESNQMKWVSIEASPSNRRVKVCLI